MPRALSNSKVGVTQTAVAAWESGKREVPKGDNLLKLAEALGFEPGELMAMTLRAARNQAKKFTCLRHLSRCQKNVS